MHFLSISTHLRGFLSGSDAKNLPTMQETQIPSLERKDPPEKGLATHFSNFAWTAHGERSLPVTAVTAGYSSWTRLSTHPPTPDGAQLSRAHLHKSSGTNFNAFLKIHDQKPGEKVQWFYQTVIFKVIRPPNHANLKRDFNLWRFQ